MGQTDPPFWAPFFIQIKVPSKIRDSTGAMRRPPRVSAPFSPSVRFTTFSLAQRLDDVSPNSYVCVAMVDRECNDDDNTNNEDVDHDVAGECEAEICQIWSRGNKKSYNVGYGSIDFYS